MSARASAATSDQTRLRAALVRRPHGVHGEVRAEPLGGDAARFAASTLLRREDGRGEHRVLDARDVAGGDVLLRLEGITSREAAERLRGVYLCVARSEARRLGEDEWFGFELVGLRAVTGDGTELGHVVDVEHYTGNDVLVVGGAGAPLRRLPFVRAFVRRVDPAAGVVELTPWEEEVASGPREAGP